MRATNLQELLANCPGKLQQKSSGAESFTGIGTDTRKDLTGQVFWALKGESFDAHDFLAQAVAQGAAAVVVDRIPEMDLGVHVILVEDTLKALQNYAREVRRGLKAKVVGITGSNGKTSTKEFLASLLKPEMKVHWNPGSFNNHFGLPFNLLQTPDDAEVVIAEMGMNHAGELTELCRIAEPDAVVCTMVGSAHIEHFGSQDKIAAAKEEIYQGAPARAVRVYNDDNTWTKKMGERAPTEYPVAKILHFSNQAGALNKASVDVVLVRDEKAIAKGLTVHGRIGDVAGRSETTLLGDHNVVNLAAAAGLALAVGLAPAKIWKNLALCKAHWGRMQLLRAEKGTSILFDGYNANPESMNAMLESLATPALKRVSQGGRNFAVLAEMRELGTSAEEAHFSLGRQAAKANLTGVYFYGPSSAHFKRGAESENPPVEFLKNLVISDTYKEELALKMASMLNPEDLVAVKASRGMKSEQFVLLLKPHDFHAKG